MDDVAKLTKITYKNPLRGTYPISSLYNVVSWIDEASNKEFEEIQQYLILVAEIKDERSFKVMALRKPKKVVKLGSKEINAI